MKPIRRISRRSFLSRVGGFSALALTGCATPREETTPYDPLENAPPRERGRVRPGSAARGCSDGDSGRSADPPDRGRRCRGRNGRH
jgi:hypothetical protein